MRNLLTAAAAVLFASSAFAQTVTVSLNSPQNGQNVNPGATINWSINFSVSSGDNAGLALLVADLVQDSANPQLINIPYAGGIPIEMANFSRPAGISNPGEGGNPSGYVGVRRGASGAQNLIQIGGGQNTFGQTANPATGVAQIAHVAPGIGQSGVMTLASGSFPAPDAAGDYTYRLENVIANVLEQVNTPPNFSPVMAAAVTVSNASISFTVGSSLLLGDMNCDGILSVGDIGGFVLALTNPAGYEAQFPNCDINAADVNQDGIISVGDIGTFVDLLT
jgi:hypothetical protein